MRASYALLGALLALPAYAAQNSPAQIAVDKTSSTGNVSILDNSGAWVMFGTLNSSTHAFLIPSSVLQYTSTTVNGIVCTLGSSCSITAPAAGIQVGSTTIAGGTNGSFEYNSSGVLGEVAATGSGNVVRATSATITTPSLSAPTVTATSLTMGQTAAGNNHGSLPLNFSSTTSGGTSRTASISTDANSTLSVAAGAAGQAVALKDGTNTLLSASNTSMTSYNGLNVLAGAPSAYALTANQLASGNNHGSMPIYMESTTSGGTVRTSAMESDANGTVDIFAGAAGQSVVLSDGITNFLTANNANITSTVGLDVLTAAANGYAVLANPIASGNNQQSLPVEFKSVSSGGTTQTSTFYLGPAGNMNIIASITGSGLQITDPSSGPTFFSVNDTSLSSNNGLSVATGAPNGFALKANPAATGNSQLSLPIYFESTNSGGTNLQSYIETGPTGDFAIVPQSLNTNNYGSLTIPTGYSHNGYGIIINPALSGNSQPSGSLAFNATDSGGVNELSYIGETPDGNLAINSEPGSSVTLADGSGTYLTSSSTSLSSSNGLQVLTGAPTGWALFASPQATGNSQRSESIYFQSKNASGVYENSVMGSDVNGSMYIWAGLSGGSVGLGDATNGNTFYTSSTQLVSNNGLDVLAGAPNGYALWASPTATGNSHNSLPIYLQATSPSGAAYFGSIAQDYLANLVLVSGATGGTVVLNDASTQLIQFSTGNGAWEAGATAISSGGARGQCFWASSTAIGTCYGTGTPTLSAAKGTIYLRNDGGGPYINVDGSNHWALLNGRYKAASFGMIGDGSTNNNTAWAAALAALAATPHGGDLYIPCGNYVITSGGSVTVPTGGHVTIRGGGPDCTTLAFQGTNAAFFAYGNTVSSSSVRDMTITTNAAGSYNGFYFQSASAQTNVTTNLYDNLVVRGDNAPATNGGGTHYWANGLVWQGVSDIQLNNTLCVGGGTGGGLGTCYLAEGYSGNPAIVFNSVNSTADFCGNGFLYGDLFQGVAFTNFNTVGCTYGIHIPTGTANSRSELTVTGSQFNPSFAGGIGIYIEDTSFSNFQLIGNMFIVQGGTSTPTYGVAMVSPNEFTITGNSFAGVGAQSSGAQDIGIFYTSNFAAGVGGIIDGDGFYGLYIGQEGVTGTCSTHCTQGTIRYSANSTNSN